MTKVNTNVSVDDQLKKLAKDNGLNVSDVLNRALKSELQIKKENRIKAKCHKCKKLINTGYACSESHFCWCLDCHEDLDMNRTCFNFHRIDSTKGQIVHHHIRFGDFEDSYGKTLKDLEKGNAEHIIK